MDDNQDVARLPTPPDRYYQPEWLDKVREEISATLACMTPAERIAYINEHGGRFRSTRAAPLTDEEKHFQPEWLEQVRTEMNHDTQGMTAEEEIAYYRTRAAEFRPKVAERQGE
jgi:hypothetical protein